MVTLVGLVILVAVLFAGRALTRRALDRVDLAVRVAGAVAVLRICEDAAARSDLQTCVAALTGLPASSVGFRNAGSLEVEVTLAGAHDRHAERLFRLLRPHVAPWLQLHVRAVPAALPVPPHAAAPAARPPWSRS